MSKSTTQRDLFTYRACVIRWIDGDTCELDVDLGFTLRMRQTVRLYGINAPEMHGDTKADGIAARSFAIGLAPVGVNVTVQTSKPREKYGRWLATIALDDGRDLAATMIKEGHAVAYFG